MMTAEEAHTWPRTCEYDVKNCSLADVSSTAPAETQLQASVPSNDSYVKSLILELSELIEDAQRQVAVTANAALTTLYWRVGHRVRIEILEGRRAKYGGKLVAAIGRQLQSRFGRSFGEKSLHHMIRFAEVFPDAGIVSALRRQLSWSHFKQLIYLPDELKRDFYAQMCRVEGWSTRVLARKVSGMLYERTALSKKPEGIIRRELAVLREKDDVSPALIFQDPYMLDFLQLADTYSETGLPFPSRRRWCHAGRARHRAASLHVTAIGKTDRPTQVTAAQLPK